MTANSQVVLDACVLVNAALRDTLLRIAEPPRLYLPRWSKEILDETMRTLEGKLGLSASQTSHLISEMKLHFEDCCIAGYENLIPSMTNDPKDRHVLAAAVHAKARVIVTFNIRHFQSAALAPWKVMALTPDSFLVKQFHLHPNVVLDKLKAQAIGRGGIERLLSIHRNTVPMFTDLLVSSLMANERAGK